MTSEHSDAAYLLARQRYADLGVDTEAALRQLATVAISLHCWQGDDVGGFEDPDGKLGGGLAATGNYPGKARTPDELRRDAAKALSLIPGTHRFNLHAFYGEFGARRVERDAIGPGAFRGLDRLGEVAGDRARLQPDVLLTSHTRPTTSPSRTQTPRSARSGSGMRRPAAGSAPRWERRSERRASRTCGSPTA